MPIHAPTVLILEDDPDVLEATTMLLESEGFRVMGASRVDGLLELAREAPTSVVLLDLSIVGVDDFIPSVRRIPGWIGQVLVFSAGDRLAERARALGADGAVSKPFDIETLIDELRERLARLEPGAFQAE